MDGYKIYLIQLDKFVCGFVTMTPILTQQKCLFTNI